MSVRRTSRPLTVAVREDLVARIAAGGMAPGSQLPPEPDLASEMGVSRATLREALRSLEEEGLVRRTRGAGTFVQQRPRVANNVDANFGVSDAIRAAGMRPGSVDGSTHFEAAGADEAARLEIPIGEEVAVVERVRTADGQRVVVSRDLFASRLLAGRRQALARMVRGSLYDVLERELGIAVHHGVASFRPERADRAVASMLGIPRGTLLLYLRQVDFDEQGRPLLLSHEHHLADAFEFTVVRRGPGRRFA